ncbi:hypothetical protein OSTOST_11386, partial [Ostertagia ostertagi]
LSHHKWANPSNRSFQTQTSSKKLRTSKQILQAAEWGRDLLAKMLVINPDNRYSVEQSLNHPYVKDEEVNAPQSENRYNEEIDCADRTLTEWKELIYQE